MSVQSDFNLSLSVSQTVQVGGQDVTVTLQSAGPAGSLTAATTPASQKSHKQTIAVDVGASVVLDLTNLSLEIANADDTDILTVDFTNLKLLQAKFRTATGNLHPITVQPAAADGYPIGERKLFGNACDGFFGPQNQQVVDATHKFIEFSSPGPATIDVILVAGG